MYICMYKIYQTTDVLEKFIQHNLTVPYKNNIIYFQNYSYA